MDRSGPAIAVAPADTFPPTHLHTVRSRTAPRYVSRGADALDVTFLEPGDVETMVELLDCLADAFEVSTAERAPRPSRNHLRRLLGQMHCIALAARSNGRVVGGLIAYVLDKFEQERSEVYLYDLAVARSHRRQGIATALIERLRSIARKRGAHVIYVQADRDDEVATALYARLGRRTEVLHFDIEP